MDSFSLWIEAKINEGDKIVIFDNGDYKIGDYDVHAEMPGYDEAAHVFHGYMFPGRKIIKITDFAVLDERKFPYDSQPEHQKAVALRMAVWKDISTAIKPGIENMVRRGEITPQWTIDSLLNRQNFKVADLANVQALSSGQAANAEKKWVADREAEGKKVADQQTAKANDPKNLAKNKENNPDAWFNRYGEGFVKFIESQSQIKWEDSEENPIEGPSEFEDCVAILSDGSRVGFHFGMGGAVRITYGQKSPKSEVGDAIEAFIKVNPDETLDCHDLLELIDNPNYRRVRPRIDIFEPFEPEPGEEVGNGEYHEPDEQPDLGQYIYNRAASRYGSGPVGPSTGYILPDGRAVQAGRMGKRDEDHRWFVPSYKAMKKWGWPDADSETEKMMEMIRRSGVIRVHVGDPFYITAAKPLTPKQRMAVREALTRLKLKTVLISFIGGREYEFTTDDHTQMRRYLG